MTTRQLESIKSKLLDQKTILERQITEYKDAIVAETDEDLKEYFKDLVVDKVSLYGKVKSELKRVNETIEQANAVASEVAASLLIDRGVESERLRYAERKTYKKSLF